MSAVNSAVEAPLAQPTVEPQQIASPAHDTTPVLPDAPLRDNNPDLPVKPETDQPSEMDTLCTAIEDVVGLKMDRKFVELTIDSIADRLFKGKDGKELTLDQKILKIKEHFDLVRKKASIEIYKAYLYDKMLEKSKEDGLDDAAAKARANMEVSRFNEDIQRALQEGKSEQDMQNLTATRFGELLGNNAAQLLQIPDPVAGVINALAGK